MKLITNRMLRGACRKQRAIFRREWPQGAPVTTAVARRAMRLGLDIRWLARLLSGKPWDCYQAGICRPQAVYDAAMYEAQIAYQMETQKAWLAYWGAAPSYPATIRQTAYWAALGKARTIYQIAMCKPKTTYWAAIIPILVRALREEK